MNFQYNIKDLWNLVVQYGYIVRYNQLDGLDSWVKLKTIISEISPKKKYKWACDMEMPFENLKSLENKIIEPIEDENPINYEKWEREHFFIQHFRIPAKNKNPKMVKILQVAYNTGQLLAEKSKIPYFYDHLNLNLEGKLFDYSQEKYNLFKLGNEIIDPINYVLNYNLFIFGDTYHNKYIYNYNNPLFINNKYENIDELYNKISEIKNSLI